jgi:hypothetical protein
VNKKIQKLVYLFHGRNIIYDIANDVTRIDENNVITKMSLIGIVIHPFSRGIYG